MALPSGCEPAPQLHQMLFSMQMALSLRCFNCVPVAGATAAAVSLAPAAGLAVAVALAGAVALAPAVAFLGAASVMPAIAPAQQRRPQPRCVDGVDAQARQPAGLRHVHSHLQTGGIGRLCWTGSLSRAMPVVHAAAPQGPEHAGRQRGAACWAITCCCWLGLSARGDGGLLCTSGTCGSSSILSASSSGAIGAWCGSSCICSRRGGCLCTCRAWRSCAVGGGSSGCWLCGGGAWHGCSCSSSRRGGSLGTCGWLGGSGAWRGSTCKAIADRQ